MSFSAHHHRDPAVRLSDEERNSAMAALGRAFAEGRITIDEYDDRCQGITRATVRGDLDRFFQDIPQNPDGSGKDLDTMYSAQEVSAAYKTSRNIRSGLLGLTTVGSIAAIPVLAVAGSVVPALPLVLIPIVWILLYIMKIGPKSWYTPSPKQIERERLREIQSADAIRNAERKAEEQARQAELKAERQRLAGELTNEAMGFAKRSLDKFTKK